MVSALFSVLAQVDKSKLDSALPRLNEDGSAAMVWIIAAVLAVGILAITFKTSKRNNILDKDL